MDAITKSLVIDDETELGQVIDQLSEKYSVVTTEKLSWRTDYLDTFDWRVWRQGDVLEYRERNRKGKLIWRNIDHRHVVAEFPVDECPDFINDLPGWLMPENLLNITRPRCVMHQAHSRSQSQQYDIVDKSDKVIARMAMVKETYRHSNNRSGAALPLRLELQSLRGFEKDFDRVQKFLQPLQLREYGKDPLIRLLQIDERHPCDYTLRLQFEFQAHDRADHVSKQILLQLLNVIELNEKGIREDLDTEFLHDMRHAVKRSHSLISQLDGILPADTLLRFDEDLLWLEEETRLLLHLNNWLLNFREYCEQVPKKHRTALQGLTDWLRSQRQSELIRVVGVLQGQHYARLMKRWRVFLECAVPDHTVLEYADSPVSVVAGKKVLNVYKQLHACSDKQLADIKGLNQLGADARVLNDLLEFSRVLFKSKTLQRLQLNASAFLSAVRRCQQRQVRVDALDQFSSIMKEDGLLDKPLKKAIIKLRETLVEQRESMHTDLLVTYRVLIDDATRKTFKRLLKNPKS